MNMTYVNFLTGADSGNVIQDYLSSSAQFLVASKADAIHSMEASWREKGLDLRVKLNAIKLSHQEGEVIHGYQLTTVAGQKLEKPMEDVGQELDVIHNYLQHFFHDLISESARNKWGLKVVN